MENEKVIKQNILKKPWIQSLISIGIIFSFLFGFIFWQATRNTVFIENSYLKAPIVNLSPTIPGILNSLYVREGEYVSINSPLALVGSQTVYSRSEGFVSNAPKLIGSYFNPGQTVVSVIDIQEMKVVGSLDETKGLKDIKVGQRASFTVDAFPGKKYDGVVDEISPTSNDTGVVFSISDKRPVKNFDIKVVFDIKKYSELKNGMSAKITVYTNQ